MKLSIQITPEMRIRLMHAENLEIEVPVSCVVPEGWKVVPVEPTIEMCDAGAIYDQRMQRDEIGPTFAGCYRSMIAAAPQPDGETI
ncbi:hypothetical protein ACET6R_11290 [Aeromonas veronii]